MNSVTVRVPASTANLGPGFDSIGCALALYNTIRFSLEGDCLCVEGCDEPYRTEDNLAVAAFHRTADSLGIKRAAGLRVSITANIPVSRGLGSSAAMITAGVLAANALYNGGLDNTDLLKIGTTIEGHPDNLAPMLYGGLTASLMENGRPYTVRYTLHPSLHMLALIPDFELSTRTARNVLPKQISHADAVFNVSHVAVLLKALESGDATLIGTALQDRLHQPYRKSLIAGYDTVEQAARECGALAVCISGAGPTLLVLANDVATAPALTEKLAVCAPNWQVLPLSVDHIGATVL